MSVIPYNKYIKIKNKYCIQYYGVEESLIKELIQLKNKIKIKYPDINFHISCRDEFHNKYKNDTVSASKTSNDEYAYIKKITYDNVNNPVRTFAKESNIEF